MEQPLTPRADQPLKSRGHKSLSKPIRRKARHPIPPVAGVPVPEKRPADAPAAEEPKAQPPASNGASDRPVEEKPRGKEQAQPEPPVESEPEPPTLAPTPTPRPDAAGPGTTEPVAQPPLVAPVPPEKPDDAGDEKKMLPDPRSADLPADKMPAEEIACRERLKALGVEFEEHKPESDPAIGCAIPYPVVLKTLGGSVAIGPGTELNCAMAEAAARFMVDIVRPAAKSAFGAELKSVSQASAFVCRPRHGTRKLSEHAFGNALDIASFTLSDGKTVEIGPTPPEKEARFLDEVRKAACGPFKTVLGPGSDADHTRHFHLDLEPRRHGGTFCQ